MKFKEEIIRHTAQINIQGIPMSNLDVAPLKMRITNLVKNDVTHITIDLSEVPWLGATMLGVLVESLSITRVAGGNLQLTGVNPRIAQILQIANLDQIFQTTPKKQTQSYATAKTAINTSVTSGKHVAQNIHAGAKAAFTKLKKLRSQNKAKVYVVGGGALKVVV